jgi:hypothetical protein
MGVMKSRRRTKSAPESTIDEQVEDEVVGNKGFYRSINKLSGADVNGQINAGISSAQVLSRVINCGTVLFVNMHCMG